MTDVVENKVVSMLDALQNGAVEIGNQVVKYTPDVVDAALKVVQLNAVQDILTAIICIVVAVISYKFAKKLWDVEWEDDINRLPSAILFIISGGTTIGASSILFNVWTWVALFYPKLEIAHMLIQKVAEHAK